MNTAIDGSMEKWLLRQIGARPALFEKKPLLLDVGAYHGDFTALCLEHSELGFRKALLFEPNDTNFQFLQHRFAANSAVQLQPFACDSATGERKFFCQGQTYTGSLLSYGTSSAAPMQETIVRCVSLDEYLEKHNLFRQAGLLKIDTQGNDLHVLQGAKALLRSGRPWIISELIYQPLYQGQAQPHEVAQFLAEYDYVMAAQFNEFYTETGWLAWSDACFVPREMTDKISEQFQSRPTGESERNSHRSLGQKVRRQIQRTFRNGRD